ncbi:MAG: class I SAM-dependent DNA methyltransferase, partial [Macromonas sp.]
QSIMDKHARRNLGAHYTSEENILKLIQPLFLDALWAEFQQAQAQPRKLLQFHQKLRGLTFLDPACGCGNFLVICYRELRLLELEVLRASQHHSRQAGQQTLDIHALIQLNVDQFYGIEIEEFPAQIAQVALWLIDHQMNLRVSEEFGLYFARIPLRTSANVVHGNALRLDWNSVLPAQRCSYVLGNPPFLGKKEQSPAQKSDFDAVMGQVQGAGVLDFVAAWYVKAAHYLHTARQAHTSTTTTADPDTAPVPRCAFVSTNSITQGEQVGVLWSWMLAQGVHIQFAHRTFKWSNEAKGKAAVHCVIVGFGLQDVPSKVIYAYEDINGQPQAVAAQNINPYLVDAPNVVLPKLKTPICRVPAIGEGSALIDNGHFLLSEEEAHTIGSQYPFAQKWIRPLLNGDDFINGKNKRCLWLDGASPAELRQCPPVLDRVEKVRQFRNSSDRAATKKLASNPTQFGEVRQPQHTYLFVPKTSSERRAFVPVGFVEPEVLINNTSLFVDQATLFHFGVLSSTMHNAWMRITCGRLKSDYRYSAAVVYNNFPWPFSATGLQPTTANASDEKTASSAQDKKAKTAIETAAQAVLDARAKFQQATPPASLADLYDPLTMPPDLLKAHQKLDAAVDTAYALTAGLPAKKTWRNDAERVAFLFEQYQRLTSLLPAAAPAKKPRRARAKPPSSTAA